MIKTLRKAAFTMAEILLSLTIIGVVAAITLPSLTGNINERTWNTQRKALYSRLSQAVALMPQIRGYGTISQNGVASAGSGGFNYNNPSYDASNATEIFISSGLAKVLKINNICDANHLSDCGIPSLIIRNGGTSKLSMTHSSMTHLGSFYEAFTQNGCASYNRIDSLAAAFETANGESVLTYYNPICGNSEAQMRADFGLSPTIPMCANFIYDLNGKKGPNTVGKDIGFMTLFNSNNPVLVAPLVHVKEFDSTQTSAARSCTNLDSDFRVPNIEEMMSIAINYKLLDDTFISSRSNYWTATTSTPGRAWYFSKSGGHSDMASGGFQGQVMATTSRSSSNKVRCIKRFN